jgi:hypothetical protein
MTSSPKALRANSSDKLHLMLRSTSIEKLNLLSKSEWPHKEEKYREDSPNYLPSKWVSDRRGRPLPTIVNHVYLELVLLRRWRILFASVSRLRSWPRLPIPAGPPGTLARLFAAVGGHLWRAKAGVNPDARRALLSKARACVCVC